MDSKRAWIVYTLIRVLAFAVPFGIIMAILPGWQLNWFVGAIVGAIVSLAISFIFLRGQRERMASDIAEMRHRRDQRTAADKEEDAELDGEVEEQPAASAATDE